MAPNHFYIDWYKKAEDTLSYFLSLIWGMRLLLGMQKKNKKKES